MDSSTESSNNSDPNFSIKKKLIAKAIEIETKNTSLNVRSVNSKTPTPRPNLSIKAGLKDAEKKSAKSYTIVIDRNYGTKASKRDKENQNLKGALTKRENVRSLSKKKDILKENLKSQPKKSRSITPCHKSDDCYIKLIKKSQEPVKPASLIKLENYFSEICNSIESTAEISEQLLVKSESMQEVLKECLTAIPDLSLQFYILMSSIIKEIQEIHSNSSLATISSLAQKLLQLGSYLEKNKYLESNAIVEKSYKEECLDDLCAKIGNVNTKVMYKWKKLLLAGKVKEDLSIAFYLLISSLDPSIQFPNNNTHSSKASSFIKECAISPGELVLLIRNIPNSISKSIFQLSTVKKINEITEKISIKEKDENSIIYNLLISTLKYYESMGNNISKPEVRSDLLSTATFKEGQFDTSLDQYTELKSPIHFSEESLLDMSFSDKNVIVDFSPLKDSCDDVFLNKSSIIIKTEPSPLPNKHKNSLSFISPLLPSNKDINKHRRIISTQPKKHISHDLKNSYVPYERFKEFLIGKITEETHGFKGLKIEATEVKKIACQKAVEKRDQ